MPSSTKSMNAEYQRLHREKLKLKYGENYNRIIREQKQKYNQPAYLKSYINDDFDFPNVPFNKDFKIYKSDIEPKATKIFAESTIKMYISNFRTFLKLYKKVIPDMIVDELKLYFNKDEECNLILIIYYFSFIENDPEAALQKIFKESSNYKNLIKAITTFSSISDLFKRTYSAFSLCNVEEIEETKRDYNDNILNDIDKDKIIDLSYETIKKHLDSLDDMEEKLIFALYTLQPPRRLDYHRMNINYKDEPAPTRDNWYNVINGNDNPYFTFYKYKTFKFYNIQCIDVNEELNKIIMDWIAYEKANNKVDTKRWRCETFPSITTVKIQKIFKKLYGVDNISINWIRKSYLSGLNDSGKFAKMTETERRDLAYNMAHSRETQNIYVLINESE